MRRAKLILVAAIAIPLAGCVLSGKPKPVAAAPAPPKPAAPAPPPEPLSIPQTQVQLPAPQPWNPDALNTEPREQPAPQTQPKAAAPPQHQARTSAAPAKPPDSPPAAAEQPAPEPARTPIHEVMPEDERNRLRDEAHAHQEQTRKLLAEARPHNRNQLRAKNEIEQFLKQSQDAEIAGDLRLADQLAERAHTLAKELQSGK